LLTEPANTRQVSEMSTYQPEASSRSDEPREAKALLTPRQREIAACVAEGLTYAEIANRLILTTGTVANHVAMILTRLGLRSRTQIAVWTVEQGLYKSTNL
jgi:DNA-binding NarL/FixJ family response regulator